MANVAWTPQARTELKEILKFIGRKDKRPLTAAKIEIEIREKLVIYAESPDIGTQHPELPTGLLCFVHKRWLIIYQPVQGGIEVLNVIDTSRDFKSLFGSG